jgi:hypothetical protein
MAMSTQPWSLFGFRVMGDVGGFTIYTDKFGRKVVYQKAPPKEPASPEQRIIRDRFGAAVRAWKALTGDEKAALERAVHACSLCLTGQNLYTSCCLRAADGVYASIARQSSEVLPPLIRL